VEAFHVQWHALRAYGLLGAQCSLCPYCSELFPPAYAASKAGIEALTRYVAVQCSKRGIRCNALAAGVTLSDSVKANISSAVLEVMRHAIYAPFVGMPEDQTGVLAFLVSDDARDINGETICTGAAQDASITAGAMVAYAMEIGQLSPDAGSHVHRPAL
jgi:NAD(P)-dependent dehydrogenase (short-subunit alcohol dehydrogenase family)